MDLPTSVGKNSRTNSRSVAKSELSKKALQNHTALYVLMWRLLEPSSQWHWPMQTYNNLRFHISGNKRERRRRRRMENRHIHSRPCSPKTPGDTMDIQELWWKKCNVDKQRDQTSKTTVTILLLVLWGTSCEPVAKSTVSVFNWPLVSMREVT